MTKESTTTEIGDSKSNSAKDNHESTLSSVEMLTLKNFGIAESESGVGAETVEKLVQEADAALEACQTLFGKVEGTTKLRKRIASELKFLQGLHKEENYDLSQVQSSNMRHLLGILHVAKTYPDVTHLLKNISSRKRNKKKPEGNLANGNKESQLLSEDDEFSITADIICNKGSCWVKVIARNAQALHLIWAGGGHYGTNTLFLQAEDFLQLAKENPINYAIPSVTFVFFNGVTPDMADALQEMGVSVVGRREDVSEETRSRLQALTDDEESDYDDDDEDGEGSHRDKRLRSESSTSSSSPSDTLGDESIEGEYILDNPPTRKTNLAEQEEEEDLNLEAQLESAVVVSASSDASGASTDSASPSNNPSSASVSASPTQNSPFSCSINTTSSSSPSTCADLDPYSVPWNVGQKRSENPRVFLDISTMIAMTSALCNGHARYVFEDKILTEQAERERESPLLPTVEPVLKDKELFTCQMAADDFRKILGIMGGKEEKARGEKLLQSLTIVEDAPSERANALKESASVKTRAKVIFGTADSLKALICSANSGFVRAAGGQGVNFAVHIHQSRALTEEKQQTASKLC